MLARGRPVWRSAVLPLFVLLLLPGLAAEEEPLGLDDECGVSASGRPADAAGEAACAVSAVQLRAAKQAAAAASTAASGAEASASDLALAAAAASHFDEQANTGRLAGQFDPDELLRYRQRFVEHVSALQSHRGARSGSPLTLEELQQALRDQEPVVTRHFAANTSAKAKNWKAATQSWGANLSMGDARKICGHISDPTLESVDAARVGLDAHLGVDLGSAPEDGVQLPANFDSRDFWPKCRDVFSHVRDQGKCGSCWAFAAAGTMDGRLCIASNGLFSGNRAWISTAYLTSCYNLNTVVMGNINGCNGGNPGSALQAAARGLFNTGGVPTGSDRQDTCVPWFGHGNALAHFSGKNIKAPPCPSACTSTIEYPRPLAYDKFYPTGKVQTSTNIEDAKRALVSGGPIPFALTVYRDFMIYVGGYYDRTTNERVGDHAAVALGYTKFKGKDYIIAMNSWGHLWGDGTGIFKMEANCCDISYYLPQIDGDQPSLPLPGTAGFAGGVSASGKKKPDQCFEHTGGTCFFLPCHASRGQTSCRMGQCTCQTGSCAEGGRCVSWM